jgi:hypothetical protein
MITIASSGLLVLGAPESIVLLVVLMVLFARPMVSTRGNFPHRRDGLTRTDRLILAFMGFVVLLGLGIIVWQRLAH